jgi:hypothetical protein
MSYDQMFQGLDGLAVTGWIVAASIAITYFSARAKRRAFELETTASALTAHYDAVDAIVDDPALPLSAVEFLSLFSDVVSDEEACNFMTDALARLQIDTAKIATPGWQSDLDKLRKSRPDLAENFAKAISSGIVALFLRWPGNAWKLQRLTQVIAADRRREALLANQIANSARYRHHGNGGDNNSLPGGLVAA